MCLAEFGEHPHLLHFFSEVISQLCKQRLERLVRKQLTSTAMSPQSPSIGPTSTDTAETGAAAVGAGATGAGASNLRLQASTVKRNR